MLDGVGELALAIDGRPEMSGRLLALAVAGCYANTLLAESVARRVVFEAIVVQVALEWESTPSLRARHVAVQVDVETQAERSDVLDLIEHVDRVSEVANSLRLGVPVLVADVRVGRPC